VEADVGAHRVGILGALAVIATVVPAAAVEVAPTKVMVTMKVRELAVRQGSPVVLLQTVDGKRFLPIWIGAAEAQAIQLRVNQQKAIRPLTHDLLESLLGVLGARIEKVEVDDLRDNVFFGKLTIKDVRGRRSRIDGRPSDLIALAVGAKLGVQVAQHVLQKAGVDPASWSAPAPSPSF
jgi:uncharacterized protein